LTAAEIRPLVYSSRKIVNNYIPVYIFKGFKKLCCDSSDQFQPGKWNYIVPHIKDGLTVVQTHKYCRHLNKKVVKTVVQYS
jgi:hypothetical protein